MACRSASFSLRASSGVALALLAVAAGPATAQQRCTVTDPTGTPLNLRTDPNGRIVGTVRNGQAVRVLDSTADGRGRPWVYIAETGTGEPLGWVFREFVSCF